MERRVWKRAWILRRTSLGVSNNLVNELEFENIHELKALLRMVVE